MGKIAVVVAGGLVTLVGVGAWFLRVEDIPEQLEPVEVDPATIVIPRDDGEDLELAALRGKTSFFVVVGPQAAGTDEGKALNRALNRWRYPETTQGYIIGDVEGFGMLRNKVAEFARHFADEVRFPVYLDYEGVFIKAFKLPKGHHGFVVLGPDGEVAMRRSGGVPPDDLDEVRALLGAEEPPWGPPAPQAFTVGPLDAEQCRARPCVFLFLGEDVSRKDIPGIEGGWEGEHQDAWAQMKKPAVRLAATASKVRLEDAALGAVVGRVDDLELGRGWHVVPDHPQARAAFEIAPGESAVVVVVDERIAFRETGTIPVYQWGRVSDLIGVEIDPGDDDDD